MSRRPRPSIAQSARRRFALGAVSLILALLLAWLGFIWHQARAVRQNMERIRSSVPAQLDQIEPILQTLQRNIGNLDWALGPVLWGSNYLGWVPSVGPLLEAAPALWDHSTSLLRVGIDLWPELEPSTNLFLAEPAKADQALRAWEQILDEHPDELLAVSAHLVTICDSVQVIDPQSIPKRFGVLLSPIQAALPLVRAAAELVPHWQQLAPLDDTLSYLLLAQNSDELRATGGFLSAIGTLQMDRGVPQMGAFKDSYAVENWDQPHPDPPAPLREHMGIDLWVTRDANWWPDFAHSAQAVSALYELNQGVETHGAAAIDTYAAAQILEIMTPLTFPDGQVIAPGGVEEAFRASWTLSEGALVNTGTIVTATQPFTGIHLTLELNRRQGTAWFDSVSLARLADPLDNLCQNPSFEIDYNRDQLPDNWKVSGFTAEDGLDSAQAHSGTWSLRIVGDSEGNKTVQQRIAISGQPGDAFVVAASSAADAISTSGGPFALTVTFIGEDDTSEALGFPTLTHDWASAGSDRVLAEWWRHRKDFMGLAMSSLLQRLGSEPSPAELVSLLGTTRKMLDQRHIQLYSQSSELQEIIERYGWGGKLLQGEGDYLCVIDSNLGYNKVSPHIAQTIAYAVTLSPSEAIGELTVQYTNQSQRPVITCDKYKQYVPTYDALAQGCYWDYVRVYVPLGARLIASSGSATPCITSTEHDHTVFDAYMELAPGESRTLHFRYALPSGILGDNHYELLVQKQAGTQNIPLQITLSSKERTPTLQNGAGTISSSAGSIRVDTDLLVDRHLSVRLQ